MLKDSTNNTMYSLLAVSILTLIGTAIYIILMTNNYLQLHLYKSMFQLELLQTYSLFFQLLTRTTLGKSVNTTEKGTLRLVKLLYLKVIFLMHAEIAPQIYRHLYSQGQVCAPCTIQISVKFCNLEELHLHQFSTNHKSLSNQAILLILRHLIFSVSKVEKKKKKREKVF